MQDHFRWDDRPAPEQFLPRVGIRVLRVEPGKSEIVQCLGNVRGLWTHWVQGRSMPCLTENCPHCPSQRWWKGYVAGCVWRVLDASTGKQGWKAVVLELTENLVHLADRDLAGLVVKVTRAGRRRNSRVDCELLEKPQHAGELPPAFDVRPIVARLFSVSMPLHKKPAPGDRPETLPFRKGGVG